jgi:hypothetical protein
MPGFQLHALDESRFAPLFALDDAALAALGARRVTADAMPGFPCRIGLADADVGEELLLLPFEHQPAASPFRASGPIYVRKGARRRTPAPGEVPDYVGCRLISVRAFDAGHCIVAATVTPGADIAPELDRLLADDQVAYLHLHHAARGCFLCRVDRAIQTGTGVINPD